MEGRSYIVCWSRKIRNVSQHPDRRKNQERLIELGEREELKIVSDYGTFQDEESANETYNKLLELDDLHSVSVAVIKTSTDYEPHPIFEEVQKHRDQLVTDCLFLAEIQNNLVKNDRISKHGEYDKACTLIRDWVNELRKKAGLEDDGDLKTEFIKRIGSYMWEGDEGLLLCHIEDDCDETDFSLFDDVEVWPNIVLDDDGDRTVYEKGVAHEICEDENDPATQEEAVVQPD